MKQESIPSALQVANHADRRAAFATKLALTSLVFMVGIAVLHFAFLAPALAQAQEIETTLKAPVTVVNGSGKTILVIRSRNGGDGELEIRNRAGSPVAGLTFDGHYGVVFYRGRGGRMVQVGE